MLTSLLNGVIRFALYNRMLIATIATALLLYGGWQLSRLPIDVFPDLNRPRVVVMTEAPGLAPEEVEMLITFPLETALNGATGVQAVRSQSGVGLSVIYVEFDWGTDIYDDRQVVAERLAVASEQLPEGISPQLAPVSSIMGQIQIAGLFSDPNEKTKLFAFPSDSFEQPAKGRVSQALLNTFRSRGHSLSESAWTAPERANERWHVNDIQSGRHFTIQRSGDQLEVHNTTSPMELRTLADWVVRQQLLTVPGVSQVFVMGGERKQFQVLVDPSLLLRYGVTLHQVETALERSNQNATGGYLDQQGAEEWLVRAIGRLQTRNELEQVVVAHTNGQSILLRQVASVIEGPQVKRGDSSAFIRSQDKGESDIATNDGIFSGGPAVVLTVNKQPGADTRRVSERITELLTSLESSLPPDIRIQPGLYEQSEFIDLAIKNVIDALIEGGVLVVIILFLFLLNFRTTFVTLTAIPLSIVITGLVFQLFGFSINTMTLGGIAVAIGELVDDAIVDVENIFRRLKENRRASQPKPALLVVFQASVEIRNSIVFGTMIVVLVFVPLFALGGLPGRLFTPLGSAYIISILSSLIVSLTVTPVLSYWLLGRGSTPNREVDGFILRFLKWVAGGAIRLSLKFSTQVLVGASAVVGIAVTGAIRLESDLLPPFNEGSVQINVLMPPGTSLKKSNEVASIVDARLQALPEIRALVRKTGRAELDEHAEGVNVSEIVATLDPNFSGDRQKLLDRIRKTLEEVPRIVYSVEQPLSHLINHMLSGVEAHVAIKLYGDDLDMLRRKIREMEAAVEGVKGVKGLQVEQQVRIPQLRINVDSDQLTRLGLTREDVTEFIEAAMNGRVVSEVIQRQRKFELVVRLNEAYREDLESLQRLSIQLPGGGTTKLENVARIERDWGPNTINREQARRRIVLQCNVGGRGLVDVVNDIKSRINPIELPEGYLIEYGGQFASQQTASRMMIILFAVSLLGMFLVLQSMFRSVTLALQVMIALQMALIGSVAALYITGQTLTVAAMVGFISLCGIASRNGILLINHYLHLVRVEGESWTREMIVRAGKERVAPVLMTALTSGIGVVPLALAAGEPWKEILYPVATVIIWGLITSTLLEFLVRPALFWSLGIDAAAAATVSELETVDLIEEKEYRHRLVESD